MLGVIETQLGHFRACLPKARRAGPGRDELQKKQVGDLLDVVAVTDPRVLQHVGVVPDFGDDGGERGLHILENRK